MGIEWREIEQIFLTSGNEIKLKKSSSNDTVLIEKLKINEQSVLGKVLSNVSGIVVNGYLRVLGREGELDIFMFNDLVKKLYPGNKLFVANDIWGGLFAISNGDFEGDKRNIWYFAPDTLRWENLDINYAEFITWICSNAIQEFYQSFMWKDYKMEIKNMSVDQAILIYPFLWADECNMEIANKKVVPLQELIAINKKAQIGGS